MRSWWLFSAALLSLPLQAQEHSAAQHTQEHMLQEYVLQEHGGAYTGSILGERVEYLPVRDALQWGAQGWYGSDLNKAWFKTEGKYDTAASALAHGEMQLLYSRAVAPYWDLQSGLRVDAGEGAPRHYAVLGLMGLAPYWFELNLAGFLSERGALSARLEADYELRFTQRLILQPRAAFDYRFTRDAAAHIGRGLGDAELGLRLRYEWRREFAPYIGVERREVHEGSAAPLESARTAWETSWLVGLRFWY
ncbi:MAG: copper resistance protein B [Pseudomonadales bacterium]|jgi:copper resistance protein B|nr:copper resistance protein B [Pseudomonadales bacterium]